VLVHADIEAARAGSRIVSVAFVILDGDKRAVEGQISDLQAGGGQSTSSVRYSRAATVEAGRYTVRIAVVDGDLVGSVEFPLRAEVARAGSLEVTELVVGGPDPLWNSSQPTLGPEVRSGLVQGYFEAYGPDAAALTATLDVVTSGGESPVLSAIVPARRGGDERFIFSKVMPVGELPPGVYRLRSTLPAAAPIVKSRPFEVITASPAAGGSVFLTVSAADLGRPFDLDAALEPATVQPLRAPLVETAAAGFDEALLHLRKRAYVDAAAGLERVIENGGNQDAALAYLGACLAAAGHDDEALAAWRKASTGAEPPTIHAWIIDALLRTKRYGEARASAEAAAARWPSDARFARPLAILNATRGNARDAVLALDRYLEHHPGDEASLFLALTWMFEARRAGLSIYERTDRIGLARRYSAQYASLNGSRQPLVRLWVDYLER
jgi:hypothetical protein